MLVGLCHKVMFILFSVFILIFLIKKKDTFNNNIYVLKGYPV